MSAYRVRHPGFDGRPTTASLPVCVALETGQDCKKPPLLHARYRELDEFTEIGSIMDQPRPRKPGRAIGSGAPAGTIRRTCTGLLDRPCYVTFQIRSNAQKYCKSCAAEANRRQRSVQNGTYYQRNRARILESRKQRYQAQVEAERIMAEFRVFVNGLRQRFKMPPFPDYEITADKRPGLWHRFLTETGRKRG